MSFRRERSRRVKRDRVPSSPFTRAVANVGRTINSAISSSADRDWFRVTLSPYITYSIRVAGKKGFDPIIDVRDSRGTSLAFNDDQSTSTRDSLIRFSPAVSGVYYLDVGGHGLATGRYRLSISEESFWSPGVRQVQPEGGSDRIRGWDNIIGPGFTESAISNRINQVNSNISSNRSKYQDLLNNLGHHIPRGEANGLPNTVFSNPLGVRSYGDEHVPIELL